MLKIYEEFRLGFSELGAAGRHSFNETLTTLIAGCLVKKGDIVLDVGGNQGDIAGPLAEMVGDTGVVHVFEPNREHWRKLIDLGSNVRLWPFAAGRAFKVSTLHVPTDLHGWASLYDIRSILPNHTFELLTTIEVPIGELPELKEQSVSFIKIDVEGHEYSVLTGLKERLCAWRPVIVLENPSKEIERLLQELNFELFDLFGQPFMESNDAPPNHIAVPGGMSIGECLPDPSNYASQIETGRYLDSLESVGPASGGQ